MDISKILLVVKREYLTRVRTRAFILSTLALPLFSLGVLGFVSLMASRQTERTAKIAILDEAGGLAQPVVQAFSRKPSDRAAAFEVLQSIEQPADPAQVRADLRARVREGQLEGYLVIPKEVLDGKPAEFHSKNVGGDLRYADLIRLAISDAVIARRLSDRGIHIDNLSKVLRGIDVSLVKVTREGETEEKGQTFVLASALAIVLYMSLLTYGIGTMRSVLEEKTTRIVEVLIASLRPSHLLAGKILGVAGVGLTQLLIWTLSGWALTTYGVAMLGAMHPGKNHFEIHLPAATLIYLVVFFLGGYFLYASLYAAVGSMVSSDEDAQQFQWPITALVMIALFLFTVILRNPNSSLSVVLSLIPFFSPILMFFRIALQTPPFWQIALSLFLLAITTLGVIYVSAKIYRVGVLMYGKRPSLLEVSRWLKYS
jgi:ABC-2 type transport system permease protein